MEGDVVYKLEITPEALDALVKLFEYNTVLSPGGKRVKLGWKDIGQGQVILTSEDY